MYILFFQAIINKVKLFQEKVQRNNIEYSKRLFGRPSNKITFIIHKQKKYGKAFQ